MTNATSKARMSSSGIDSTGLSRWTWTWLEDRYKTFATYIFTYCPCISKSKQSTTWNQYVHYFRDRRISELHPRDVFDGNFIDFLCQILRRGDNVVLGIDINEDVRSSKVAKHLNCCDCETWFFQNTLCYLYQPPSTRTTVVYPLKSFRTINSSKSLPQDTVTLTQKLRQLSQMGVVGQSL